MDAKNKNEAVNLAEKISPDLVMLDVTAVSSDKFETIYYLRNTSRLENLPIILFSGNIHFNSFSIPQGHIKNSKSCRSVSAS